jgi:LPXTG-site transpeptidase (sortase) family protein
MKLKNSTYFRLFFAQTFLVLIFLFFIGLSFFSNRSAFAKHLELLTARFNKNIAVQVDEPFLSGKPTQIIIPSLQLEVGIRDGNYDSKSQSWTLSRDSSYFATASVLPNNKSGMTIIYGHNDSNIFGKINQLKIGDIIYLQTENDLIFKYKLTNIEDVLPDNTQIFNYLGEPMLTIITCSGSFDQTRKQMMFEMMVVLS